MIDLDLDGEMNTSVASMNKSIELKDKKVTQQQLLAKMDKLVGRPIDEESSDYDEFTSNRNLSTRGED